MGSTVFANKKAVATTTTPHWAHSLVGDIRLVGPQAVPTLLPNNVKSAQIYADFPTKTLFANGNIWVEGTKAGPKSDPIDTWPGFIKASAINSYATTMGGSGSDNVYVEAKKVWCITHFTEQNEGNSIGIIDDKPGVVVGKNDGKGQGKGVGFGDGNTGTKSAGDEDGEKGKKDDSDKKKKEEQKGKEPTTECTIKFVKVTDGRRQQSDPTTGSGGSTKAYLQVTSEFAGKVKFDADMTDCTSGEHPLWEIEKVQTKAKTVDQEVSSGASQLGRALGSLSAIINVARIYMQDPRTYTGTFSTHNGTHTRVVDVFPYDKHKKAISLFEGVDATWITNKLKSLLRWIPGLTVEVKAWKLGIELALQWKEQKDWKVALEAEAKLEGTIIAVSVEKRMTMHFLKVIPAVAAYMLAAEAHNAIVKEFNESFFATTLDVSLPTMPIPEIYIKVELEVKVAIGLTWKGYHNITAGGPFDAPKGRLGFDEFSVEGEIELQLIIGCSLGNEGTSLFAIGGELIGKGTFAVKPIPKTGIKGEFGDVIVQGRFYFSWDLMTVLGKGALAQKVANKLNDWGLPLKGKKEIRTPPWKAIERPAEPLFEWKLA